MSRYNPYKEAAAKIDKEWAEQQAQAGQTPETPPAPPDLTLVPAGEPKLLGADQPPTFPPAPPPPPPSPAPQPEAPLPLAAEADEALRAELADLRKQMAESQTKLKEYEAAAEERRIADAMNLEGVDLESMDKGDAKKLIQALYGTVKGDQEKALQEVARLREEQNQRAQTQAETLAKRRADEIYGAVLKAVPDFKTLVKDPKFEEFLNQPVRPGSALTNRVDLGAAYEQGRAEYIAQAVQAWRSGQPSPEDIAQVAAGNAAPGVVAPSEPIGPDQEFKVINDLLRQVQSGAISRDEYRARLAKHREGLAQAGLQ